MSSTQVVIWLIALLVVASLFYVLVRLLRAWTGKAPIEEDTAPGSSAATTVDGWGDAPLRQIRILFLASNPADTARLRLGDEIRAIDQALQAARFRDRFDLEQQWAVRVGDLQSLLLRYEPDIVHFSGHGSSASEIVLEDADGQSRPVPQEALSQLFALLAANAKCVVLNACFSRSQAEGIAQSVDCVIGMSDAISDETSVVFSASFYRALAYGKSVRTAFDLGVSELDLEGSEESAIPQLLSTKANPEDVTFV